MKIPFCKTTLGEEEKKAICETIDSGWVVLGPKSKEFEERFADYVGGKHAIFVDSGTAALDLAVKYIKIHRDWKHQASLQVPSLTFAATAEVIVNNGFKPDFVDTETHSLLINQPYLNGIHVHLCGERNKTNAPIYDSAHRIEADDVANSPSIWCYSFYATKNMTTCQGGMIVTNYDKEAEWFRSARDHGLDFGTAERYKGRYKQYDIKFVGYRYKGDDLRASIGIEQLKKLPAMTKRRNEIVNKYNEGLLESNTGNHVYPILVNNRENFMDHMHEKGIQTTVHFRPLHEMTAYKKYALKGTLPNTEWTGEHIVSLPLYPDMTPKEVQYVIDAVKEYD